MSDQPKWLCEFVDQVCACLRPLEEMPPIGCHVSFADQTWEISVFISPTELVGGRHDGERISCLFAVDIIELLHVFDVVESAGWQPHQQSEDDELGNHLAVHGYFEGHPLWLRVLADSPERYVPGRYLNVNEQSIIDTWRI